MFLNDKEIRSLNSYLALSPEKPAEIAIRAGISPFMLLKALKKECEITIEDLQKLSDFYCAGGIEFLLGYKEIDIDKKREEKNRLINEYKDDFRFKSDINKLLNLEEKMYIAHNKASLVANNVSDTDLSEVYREYFYYLNESIDLKFNILKKIETLR